MLGGQTAPCPLGCLTEFFFPLKFLDTDSVLIVCSYSQWTSWQPENQFNFSDVFLQIKYSTEDTMYQDLNCKLFVFLLHKLHHSISPAVLPGQNLPCFIYYSADATMLSCGSSRHTVCYRVQRESVVLALRRGLEMTNSSRMIIAEDARVGP